MVSKVKKKQQKKHERAHKNNNFWNPYILYLGKPGITSTVLESHQKSLKVASKWARAARVYPDSCLNPLARHPQCHFPPPRTLTKVDRAEQSFLSISDNNKTSDINPHSVPPLLCSAAFHQHPGSAAEGGGRERREGERKRGKARR